MIWPLGLVLACSFPAPLHAREIWLDDIFQVTNPIFGLYWAYKENKTADFVSEYLTAAAITGISKHIGTQTRFCGSQRPDKTAWTGMPSGHTTSAWLPAAYTRSPFIYIMAIETAALRVLRGKHYWYQCLTSVILSEAIVALNHRYTLNIFPLTDGMAARIIFTL